MPLKCPKSLCGLGWVGWVNLIYCNVVAQGFSLIEPFDVLFFAYIFSYIGDMAVF